jgi:hypothetical protein
MRTLLVAVAFATALIPSASYAASSSNGGACTSLNRNCVGACGAGFVVTVRLIGHGYGEASCGNAVASCESTGPEGCTQGFPTASAGTLRCIAIPQDPETVAVAICTANTVGP